jgi:hypothetical protein
MATPATTTPLDDESTIDSIELSIHEEQKIVLSETPKSLAPQPILLHLPPNIHLGVELSLSLPIVAYIHPTSPLLGVIHVGDVLLELDGVKTTELEFVKWHSWLAGNSNHCDGKKRSMMFLPGRKSPFSECRDGLRHSSLVPVVKFDEPKDESMMMTMYSRQETGTTVETSDASLQSVCTLYLADDGGSLPSVAKSTTVDTLEEESSIITPTHQLHQCQEEIMEEKKDPVSPSTTATTKSCDSRSRELNDEDGLGSNVMNDLQLHPDLMAPDLNCHNIIMEMTCPVSLNGDLEEIKPTSPLSVSSCQEKMMQGDECEHDKEEVSESSSLVSTENRESQHEFDSLCQSVLEKNGLVDASVNNAPLNLDSDQIESQDETVMQLQKQAEIPIGDTDDTPSLPAVETEDSCINKDTHHRQTPIPPASQDPSPQEEEHDWEKLEQKRRKRPPPTFDTITIDYGCEEDVSTIFGGKYNPSLYASNARLEDNITDNYDPNNLSQLKLHGVPPNLLQQESLARKLALEDQDHQRKLERLNLLKRRHCIVEGIIGVFIFMAVVVLIGVLVVALRG